MSQLGSLGTPINSTLNFQPGGNPIAGLAGGGLAGLGASYAQDYQSYLNTNQTNYNNIIGGYQTVMNNIGNTLGQGGTPYGIAQGAANQITMRGNQAAGGAIQNSINSGVGKSTAAVAAQRGTASDTNMALGQLGNELAGTYAGYESNLGQSQLNFMNSVSAPPPNAAAYSSLAQQYGVQQQGQANLALQQQALAQQQQASRFAAARSQSGGGGVGVGAAPRGGTFGSGGGGFPSGSGVTPSSGGSSNVYNPASTSTGSFGIGGNGILNLPGSTAGSGFNPWDPIGGAGSAFPTDPYGDIGDPFGAAASVATGGVSGVTNNFGNAGYELGSGVG